MPQMQATPQVGVTSSAHLTPTKGTPAMPRSHQVGSLLVPGTLGTTVAGEPRMSLHHTAVATPRNSHSMAPPPHKVQETPLKVQVLSAASKRQRMVLYSGTRAQGCSDSRAWSPGLLSNDRTEKSVRMPAAHQLLAGCLAGGQAAKGSAVGDESQVVHINVGGHMFKTHRSTLENCPERSWLRKATSGYGNSYFIDRDGRHFEHVLNYLEGKRTFRPPDSLSVQRELYREALFYGILQLALSLPHGYVGAPLPTNEKERLKRLHSLGIFGTGPRDPVLDGIVKAVRSILKLPIVALSLVGEDRQLFKSKCGMATDSLPRNSSICAMTFKPEHPEDAELLVIEDTTKFCSVCQNPLVVDEPSIRFYAGCPLVTSDGFRLGALCVMDKVPRAMTLWQLQLLATFGYLAVQELERSWLVSVDPLKAPRGEELPVVSERDLVAGPERLERMRQSLGEMICLVQVMDDGLPILWGSRAFNIATGIEDEGTDTDSMSTDDAMEAPPTNFDSIFEFGDAWSTEKLQSEFEREVPRVFALSGRLVVPGEKDNHKPVCCRVVPAEQPLDIAAAAVKVPKPSSGTIDRHSAPSVGRVYFVLMVFCEGLADGLGATSACGQEAQVPRAMASEPRAAEGTWWSSKPWGRREAVGA